MHLFARGRLVGSDSDCLGLFAGLDPAETCPSFSIAVGTAVPLMMPRKTLMLAAHNDVNRVK